MATLEQLHWEKVSPLLRDVIIEIGHHPFAQRFYLAGGTALTLQLGHRVSVDLDFFSTNDELLDQSRQEVIAALEAHFAFEVIHNVAGSLLLNIQGTAVGFFSYGYPLLAPTVMVAGVPLAGLLDIGLMKLDAIAGRGTRKDFYDFYFIARQISLDILLDQGQAKYPHTRDFGMMVLEALVDFSVADQQAAIETFPPISWAEVKAFCLAEMRRIGRDWFEAE